jgi:hypothetical protein
MKGVALALWCVAAMLVSVFQAHAASTGGLALGSVGSVTSDPTEIVGGTRSIKGAYFGTNEFNDFLRSTPSSLPLKQNQTYQITFRYKILSTLSKEIDFFFFSPAGNSVLGSGVTGSTGSSGVGTLTSSLGPFDDYQVIWTVHGTGAIAIDDIQIKNLTTGAVIAVEDAEPGARLLSTFFVSANKPSFIWGEPVKVSAEFYDENGNALNPGAITWSVNPSSAATIAADGTITPLALATFTVHGAAAGSSGDVFMQVLPKQILVVPEKPTMLVGSTQKVRADVLDINDKPISNAAVKWSIASESSSFSPSATIDASGTLKAVNQSRVRVVARLNYSQNIPNFDTVSQGDTLVDIKAPTTYRFERIFVSRDPADGSSILTPVAAPLVPTETGGFMFAASLDGLGTALLEWNNGNLRPILSSGRVNPVNGYPLATFTNYLRTPSGQVLVQETDTSGSGLLSRGAPGVVIPIFAPGSALFGAQSTGSFDMSRSALADSGAMVLRVGYTDAVTKLNNTGLYRGFGGGIAEPIINIRDPRLLLDNGVTGFFDNWGIGNDGTVWFVVGGTNKSEIWRAPQGDVAQRLVGIGDPFIGETFRGVSSNFRQVEPIFFVAGNGDFVSAVSTDRGQRFILWPAAANTPALTLQANAFGIFSYDANFGALLDAQPPGKQRGLYLWNSNGAKALLSLNDTSIDGSAIQEILSAASTADGTVYVMVRTLNNPMVIARLSPSPQVLLQAGDSVPVTVPPVITGLIPGARAGTPLVIAGGASGSIAKVEANGDITRVIAVGDKLPDGRYFAGTPVNMVRTMSDGRIVFGHDYFASDSSLFIWNQGKIDILARAPFKDPTDGSSIGYPRNIEVNRQGDIAFQFTFARNPIYRIRNGSLVTATLNNPTVDGVTVQNSTLRGIDDSGSIVFSGTKPDGSSFYVGMWDGNTTHLIMAPNQKLPDGRLVTTNAGTTKACGDSFTASALSTIERYRNGAWSYLVDPAQTFATGGPANNVNGNYDVNHLCDGVFTIDPQANGAVNLGARVNGTYHEIQDLQQLTPDGDLLSVTQMLINDDGTIYVLGANDRGEEVLYRGTPLNGGSITDPGTATFQIADRAGMSQTTSGSSSSVQVGFARIVPNSGNTTPSGMAIFDVVQNGILISEAAVPASPLIQSGRIYAEIAGAVNTGMAIANPNSQAATISFYYTDASGTNVLSGTMTVNGKNQVAAFLNQAPFVTQSPAPNLANVRTFTFSSSLPVGVTALRGYTNERGEFLITTLPVSAINTTSPAAFAFPHFADGGGWISSVVLINPTDSTISGSAQFYSQGSASTAGAPVTLSANGTSASSFSYTIPARSAFRLQTSGAGATTRAGWVQITPTSGAAPSGLVVFSYQANGVRVSEAGVPALQSGSAFRLYAEASGPIQTGIAISNSSSLRISVNFELSNLDGTPTGITGSTTIPATGQVAMFLNQIPGFSALPAAFKGVLRVTTTGGANSSSNISITGLRGRYNERGDFLITTTVPVDETASPSTSEFLFPHLADGGGYTTQIILFSGTAGQSTNGTLQFVSQTGQALSLTLY